MSGALRLELDRADHTYRPGERIRGRAVVTAETGLDCHDLDVWLEVSAVGRAPAVSEERARTTVFSGHIERGEELCRAFQIEAPPGPLSYDGKLVRVAWRLCARASLDLRFDLTHDVEIVLVPWSEMDTARGYRDAAAATAPTGYEQGPVDRPRLAARALVESAPAEVAASGFGLMGAGLVVAVVASAVGTLAVAGAAGVAALAGAGLLLGQRVRSSARRIGQPVLTVEPILAAPGDPVAARLVLEPKRAATLARAELALIGEELAVRPGESEAEAHREELHADRRSREAVTLVAGEKLELDERFRLPEDAAPSYADRWNDVRWVVRATLVMADGDTWRHVMPVVVRPRGVGSPASDGSPTAGATPSSHP